MSTLSDIIIYGNVNELEQTLARTENLNYLDEYGYTPLIETLIIGDNEKSKLLLQHDVDVKQKDLTKRCALHWAVSNDNCEMIKLLLEKGADANAYNIASEPVLSKAILRDDKAMKDLLAEHGADYTFAYDYINAKLAGHSFELIGSVDIVDANNVFTEVDYEGFYLEFCLDLIGFSLQNFKHNYAARPIRDWFDKIDSICKALKNAEQLLKYDHYLLKKNFQLKNIESCVNQDPLIIPINQEAHAISIVKAGSLLAICDRAKEDTITEGIPIYYMNRPSQLSSELIADIMYNKHKIQSLQMKLQNRLNMQPVDNVPLSAQIIGNCSWANTEAVIPTLTYMLNLNDPKNSLDKSQKMVDSLELFQRWKLWHQERALQFLIKSFKTAGTARKASIAALLAAILFQTCAADDPEQVERAKRIIPVLKTKGYEYILQSYLEFYTRNNRTAAGENLEKLLKIYQIEEEL